MSVAVVATGATTAQVNQAVALLGDNQQASSSGAMRGLTTITIDTTIDAVIDTAQWVADKLPTSFFSWIAQTLAKVHETLESLTGSSADIGNHIGNLMRASQQVAAQQARAAGCGSVVGQVWQGQAFDAFSARIQAVASASSATAGVLASDAERHLVLAGQLTDAKLGVIKLVADLARNLCSTAFRVLADCGLQLVAGLWTLGPRALAGGVSGGFKGAVNGFRKGGLGGMISGGFHGAVDGAKESVESVIMAALNKFLQWATNEAGKALQSVASYVRQFIDTAGTTIGQIADTGMRAERAAALLRGHADPGSASDAPQQGSYGDQAMGANPQARDGDLVKVNEAIGDSNAPLPPGYQRANDADLAALGLRPDQLKDHNGFQAEVFKTPEGGYVVAFAGTGAGGGKFWPDAAEDGVGAATVSPQTRQVLEISDAIERSGKGDQVVYTGHSLGGRQAAIAAMNSGQPAVTYDAAGVSQSTVNYVAERNGDDPAAVTAKANDTQIRRYYASDDPLTALQEGNRDALAGAAPDAVGRPIRLGDTPANNTSAGEGAPDMSGHDLTHAGDLWEQKYGHLRDQN